MDLSKLIEIKEQKAEKEIITERDENGKPVAGRYPWGDVEECPDTNELKEPLYKESLENGIEAINPEEEEDFTILDIDQGVEGIHLTPDQEREAQDRAISRTSAWMKTHPNYMMDELKIIKAGFLEEERKNLAK